MGDLRQLNCPLVGEECDHSMSS